MPSENKSTAQNCGSTYTSTSLPLSTYIDNTGGFIIPYTNPTYVDGASTITISNPTLWASGTSYTNSIIYNSDVNYKYPKDGEVRIDPDTGESMIFLSDYNEWVECDISEFRKEKDENGNKRIVVSVTFGMSVARLKKKQNERIVLTEKVKKVKVGDILYFSGNVTGINNIAIGNTTLINYIPTYSTGINNITIGGINNNLTFTNNYSIS